MVKLTFEYLVLTATRSSEVRAAAWMEIDRDEGVWTIPARRTKGNREHRVPLSRRAVEILERRGRSVVAVPSYFRACTESHSGARRWRACFGR